MPPEGQALSARPLGAMLDLEHKIEFTLNSHLSRYQRRVRNIDVHGWKVEVANYAFVEMLVTQKHHAC